LIVKAIIELAQGLGLTATAEGVETVEQLRLMHELGCDVVQGYLISQPLEPDSLQSWKQEFKQRWPALIADEGLALWGHVETDTLG
jgi:EAL domain-containing protein (putative c-di-GMP-specific phosphodiesterase class I)